MAGAEGRPLARLAVWSLGLGLVALAGLAGATAVESRQLAVGDFDRVHFSGAGTVRLSQGSSPRLSVRGAAGIMDRVRVETRDGVLHIETAEGAGEGAGDGAGDLVFDLRVRGLTEFVSEGAGHIRGDGLQLDALALEGSGAGSFDLQRLEARALNVRGRGATRFALTGQVQDQVVELNGSGAYRAAELVSERARIHVAGASRVRLWADELLDVVVAGAADIRYAGSPRVEQRISGAARIRRLPVIVI